MKRLLVVLVAVMAGGTWSRAEERTARRYDTIGGFSTASIFSLAQDTEGFLWAGIDGGGLARFDGREFRRWAPQTLKSHLYFGRGAGEDLVLIVEPDTGAPGGNTLQRIAGDDVVPIDGPDGTRWSGVRDAAYDLGHRLWVARHTELFYRSDRGEWIPLASPLLTGSRIRRLAPNRQGGIFVVTNTGILSIDRGGVVSRIVETSLAADVVDRGDGSIFFVEKKPLGGAIFELRDGRTTELLFRDANFIAFVLRGRTAWAAFDSGVVALRPGESPEVLGPAQGVPGGGGLVDLEGSLWVATAAGLVHIAEPETALWTERDGLPVASSRYLATTKEGVWVSTWGGLCRLTRAGGAWNVAVEEKVDHKWPLMTDGRGRLWAKDRDDFLERVGGRFKRYHVADSGVLLGAAPASDGTLWLGTDRGLFKTTRSETTPVLLVKPADADVVEQVFEDARGQLWMSSRNRIYHAASAAVTSGKPFTWTRNEIDGARQFSKITETSDGTLWASNWLGGVWRYQSGAWAPIPASLQLPSRTVQNLVPSRSGGMWVLSTGTMLRVIDRPQSSDGWEVVEQLNGWQGLPPTSIADLVEESDGTLWIATAAGVVRIRPEARRSRPFPPLVKHTAFVIDGQPLALDTSTLDAGRQVELRFAALSYRSPGLLKYQYRLRADGSWIDSSSQEAVFRFPGLMAGRYRAEVRASLDGVNWSATPARVDFEVLGPWYLRWWAIGSVVLILAAVLAAAHRARVAMVVRLERQRAAIARDLHDGIGSGLGSIGILAGVVASDTVGDTERRERVRDIADTAAELGSTLTDIVWSLRPDSATLEGLAQRLTQRGSRLFPDACPAFSTELPTLWPAADLALSVRHNLLLITSEALHNAARHAKAQRVVLGMAPRGRSWALWVTDDGCGLGRRESSDANCTGLGLPNMRKRADDIGARIDWSARDGGGTTVTVIFTFDGHARR